MTPEGALQFWGGDAPVYLRWMYVFWVLGVLLVEYGSLLPKATILLTHLASVAVAVAFQHRSVHGPDSLHALLEIGAGGEHLENGRRIPAVVVGARVLHRCPPRRRPGGYHAVRTSA